VTAKNWFVFWCGVVFGQIGLWVQFFGWKGAVPSLMAGVLLFVTLVRQRRETRLLESDFKELSEEILASKHRVEISVFDEGGKRRKLYAFARAGECGLCEHRRDMHFDGTGCTVRVGARWCACPLNCEGIEYGKAADNAN
jgi:hypothetical protein